MKHVNGGKLKFGMVIICAILVAGAAAGRPQAAETSARQTVVANLSLKGCGELKTPAVGAEAELLKAEIEFCRESAVEGADAWAHWFAENGSELPQQGIPAIGPDAVRDTIKGLLTTPGLVFYWNAKQAEVMPNGMTGYTVGRYHLETPGKDGKANLETGSYITIWRKQKDGAWRVFADTGAPDSERKEATKAKAVPVKEKNK